MLKEHTWLFSALTAAMSWGIHYAAAGALSKKLPASLITILYLTLVTVSSVLIMIFIRGPQLLTQDVINHLNLNVLTQLGIMVVTGCLSNFLIFNAIADSTATKASIVEITYPLFVALFSLVIYGENSLNLGLGIGGLLIFSGVIIVFKS